MRDLEAYKHHGRNNPRDPEQRREHPYDFVSLPASIKTVETPGHDRYPEQLYSGTLTLVYRIVTPLHVGSGSFESSAACGLTGEDQPVRGIVRRAGLPVLPGSSWKGAVRSRYEAITQSRLALAKDFHKLDIKKVPRPLQDLESRERKYQVKILDPRLRTLKAKTVQQQERPEETRKLLRTLSPAESLFGAMGYRGRIHPADGAILFPKGSASRPPLRIAPMETPAAHRLARPGAASTRQGQRGEPVIEIREVEGRKFYYDGGLVTARHSAHGEIHPFTHELVDYVPAGSEITLDIHLEAAGLAEIGALLVSAGRGPDAGILRFGGFKPAGLGKVELLSARTLLHQGAATRTWKRSAPAEIDLEEALREARENLIDSAALQELHSVTTLQRP